MKIVSFLGPKTLSKKVLLLLTFLLSQPTMAVIIVHFVEEESDVRVSFSGSIELSGAASPSVFGPASNFISDSAVLRGGTIGSRIANAGSNTSTSLSFRLTPFTDSVEIFGFNSSALFFSDRHNIDPDAGAPTILTTDPSLDTFLITDRTLLELRASANDIEEGALLWTANGTADTFIFSRLAPVPEPSVIALGGVALLGILRRRR